MAAQLCLCSMRKQAELLSQQEFENSLKSDLRRSAQACLPFNLTSADGGSVAVGKALKDERKTEEAKKGSDSFWALKRKSRFARWQAIAMSLGPTYESAGVEMKEISPGNIWFNIYYS